MAEAQQVQLHVMEAKGSNSTRAISHRTESRPRNYMISWLRIALYTIFVLCGQTSATLLTRLYYEKGGSSQWMGTLVMIVGFPVLLPYYYCISQPKVTTPNNANTKPPSLPMLVFVYVSIGLLAAGNSFLYSLTFRKVLKRQTFRVVMDLIIYQSLVASAATLIAFFATGDWKGLKREMEGYELGKISYVMILLWTAIAWQIFGVGSVALIVNVSALFCNVISALGLRITPIMAMFVFHGVKGISMVLAIWGFISYLYQHYLDNCRMNAENKIGSTEASEA
ncbi:hypothetical protein QQP08_019464 [Theobroma cacao]|nr:hypothetical protein QQP08_019464 [Theobroma cacao]